VICHVLSNPLGSRWPGSVDLPLPGGMLIGRRAGQPYCSVLAASLAVS
jgi:hypothetical protein